MNSNCVIMHNVGSYSCRYNTGSLLAQSVNILVPYIYIYIYIYLFMSSCVGGSKAPLGTISAIYTRYAGTISTSYKKIR